VKLSGNAILLTGASAGIGFEMAKALLELGNRVLTCGRRQERLEQARAQLPQLETFACDIGSADARRELMTWAKHVAPELNVLINNAGIQHRLNLLAGGAGSGQYDELAINLEAPMHLCELAIPHLAAQANAAIVNITSGLAFTPSASVPVYSASKAAMHSYSLSLRYQLRGTRIKVFEVAPPLVQSELHNHQLGGPPPTAGMATDEFVRECLRGLSNDVYTNAIGMAAKFYAERENMLPVLNPP
jgi:uncharacterized oxidoreductase